MILKEMWADDHEPLYMFKSRDYVYLVRKDALEAFNDTGLRGGLRRTEIADVVIDTVHKTVVKSRHF